MSVSKSGRRRKSTEGTHVVRDDVHMSILKQVTSATGVCVVDAVHERCF